MAAKTGTSSATTCRYFPDLEMCFACSFASTQQGASSICPTSSTWAAAISTADSGPHRTGNPFLWPPLHHYYSHSEGGGGGGLRWKTVCQLIRSVYHPPSLCSALTATWTDFSSPFNFHLNFIHLLYSMSLSMWYWFKMFLVFILNWVIHDESWEKF